MIDPQVELTCQDLIVGFLQSLDERKYDEVCAAFDADSVWDRAGVLLTGPEEVRAAMNKRPADMNTVHLATNFRFEQSSPAEVTVQYLLLGYVQRGDQPANLHGIFRAEDRLRNIAGGWRFVHRKVSTPFPAVV